MTHFGKILHTMLIGSNLPMNNSYDGATRYFAVDDTLYKPIHIPTYEDTPENIERCNNCVFCDCVYENVNRCITINGVDFESAKRTRKPKPKAEPLESTLMPIAHAKSNK